MSEGFFTLNCPSDLLKKLERDMRKLESNPLDSDLAYNFFVTAHSMLDWIHPGDDKPARDARTNLMLGDIWLRICFSLANGGKHFRLEKPGHNTVASTGMKSPRAGWFGDYGGGLLSGPYWGERTAPKGLYIDLKGDAASELGQEVEVVTAAHNVLAYWKASPLVAP